MEQCSVLEVLDDTIEKISKKSKGFYLYQHLHDLCREIEPNDRDGLVMALSKWVREFSLPKTTMAIYLAGDLQLTELKDLLREFQNRIRTGDYGPKGQVWLMTANTALDLL